MKSTKVDYGSECVNTLHKGDDDDDDNDNDNVGSLQSQLDLIFVQ